MSITDRFSLNIHISDPLWYQDRRDYGTVSPVEYTHEISAIGGFNNAEISIHQSDAEAENWISFGLGRHVHVYDNTLRTAWEGFVNEVSISMGTVALHVGPLMDVGNRVLVEYTPMFYSDGGEPTTGTQTETPIIEDFDSQARYSILEKILSGGQLWEIEEEGVFDAIQLRDMFLSEAKAPDLSHEVNLVESSSPTVTLGCLGYFSYFDQYIYNKDSSNMIQVPFKIMDIINADPNNLFSRDYRGFDTSIKTLLIVNALEEDNRTAQSVLNDVLELGDADNRRTLLGIYENRRAYFYRMPTVPKYIQHIKSNFSVIEDANGVPLAPWLVRAGQWLRFSDILTGANIIKDLREDSRNLFIENARYSMPNELFLEGSKARKMSHLQAKLMIGGW